ncbi:MAG: 2-dehydropantoate 2-reductase N-terminal domain-containing protein, partial [Clostridiales bacterium]
MNISVIGAGGWGTTLAVLLHYNNHKVSLWEYDKNYANDIIASRENKLYLPGIEIPEGVIVTNDLTEASNSKDMLVLAVPSQFLRSVIQKMELSA